MSANQPILIASSSFDEHTHGPVRESLIRSGRSVVVYETDRVMTGDARLSVDLTDTGALLISYDGTSIAPEDIAAAWYWKVANFQVPDAEVNVAKQLTMVNEITQFNQSLWSLFPEELWLSAPTSIARAERKLGELVAANAVGFTIPSTHIGSDWDPIRDAQSGFASGLVVKMFRGVIADENTIKAMYTTRLDHDLLDRLASTTIPFPGMYQPFIPKAREWRVTVVGDEVFAGAIYTDHTANDDWRRLQETAAVAFRREQLPEQVAQKCRSYLRRMGLGLGSFDLVETPEGDHVFLECNPNGQFGFLEELLDLPIADAVAAQLIQIAARNDSGSRHVEHSFNR